MRLNESTLRRLQTQLGLHECSFERLRDFARAIEAEVAEHCAKLCSEYGDMEWSKFKRGPAPYQGNPYTAGLSDAGHELHNAIRDTYKEPTNGLGIYKRPASWLKNVCEYCQWRGLTKPARPAKETK